MTWRGRRWTAWSGARRRSSRTRCRNCWRPAGALAWPSSSSARTPRWSKPSRSRRERAIRTMETTMTTHKLASREAWRAARAALLEREKEHTRIGDQLAQQRRELPWIPIEKQYVLQTAGGPKTLAELFEGRSQLLIYHFMFGPSYETGCPVNSSIADSFDSLIPHVKARDVTLIAVSGAPIEKLLGYQERMGWTFGWASSHESDFNADLGFSRTP